MEEINQDILLWKKVQKGDRKSFDQLFRIYVDVLYDYGVRFGAEPPQVEDSIQDFCIYIWNKKEQIHIRDSVKFYFIRSFRRTFLKKIQQASYKNSNFRSRKISLSSSGKCPTLLIREEADKISRQKLQQALELLSPRQKEAIFLRYFENFDNEETAEIMGISVGALYKLVSYALKKMRENIPTKEKD